MDREPSNHPATDYNPEDYKSFWFAPPAPSAPCVLTCGAVDCTQARHVRRVPGSDAAAQGGWWVGALDDLAPRPRSCTAQVASSNNWNDVMYKTIPHLQYSLFYLAMYFVTVVLVVNIITSVVIDSYSDYQELAEQRAEKRQRANTLSRVAGAVGESESGGPLLDPALGGTPLARVGLDIMGDTEDVQFVSSAMPGDADAESDVSSRWGLPLSTVQEARDDPADVGRQVTLWRVEKYTDTAVQCFRNKLPVGWPLVPPSRATRQCSHGRRACLFRALMRARAAGRS